MEGSLQPVELNDIVPQVFIEYLLWARYSLRHRGSRNEQNRKYLLSLSLHLVSFKDESMKYN